MTGFEVALLVYAAALIAPGLFCLWRIPVCPAAPREERGADRPKGKVSVIVPAYNEERRIAPLLESLARQSRPPDELIVVDDQSTDGTATVALRMGAAVRRAAPRPPGWIGKTWACWSGWRAATGDVLVFLDADVRLAPDGLARLLGARDLRGGLLTVQPYHEAPRLIERLSAVCNVVIMGSIGAFTPFGERLAGGAFGPCLAISSEDYRRLGGHAAVHDRVIEDVALGDRARRMGMPVCCLAGRGAVSFRMYPEGLRAMVEGWSKSLASGAADSPLLPRRLMTAWLVGATTAVIALAAGIHALAALPPRGAFGAAAVGLYLAYAVQAWWMFRRVGSFGPLTALAYPLPLAFFHAVFVRSAWLTARGRVRWRGRTVAVPGIRMGRENQRGSRGRGRD